ncbi:MAG: 1-acyl-sn-glycerol-3-phosphate acyltransferase [Hormoscilla sp. GM102CHS1]|nr:1-acyl-sn-glycerol-3-phosphate acyltransferase [Hormoscilla sp. GM102CHS1]
MSSVRNKVQPALEFIPPAFNPTVLRVTQWLLPLWLNKMGCASIETENVKVLADIYRQFDLGETRFLIAFRHPNSPNDAFCMAHLLWQAMPQAAKDRGLTLKYPVHSHFIYDRGIPIWAGSFASWMFSRLGGSSMQRGKLDRQGLRSARNLMTNGQFPIAIAPEGGTNDHSEIVSPLEPGVAQIGFWCVEDLQAAGRDQQVVIVPVSIQYSYVTPPWLELEKLLSEVEADLGLPQLAICQDEASSSSLYLRLFRAGEELLSLMEKFYNQFYHQQPTPTPSLEDPNAKMAARLQALLDTALRVCEEYFDIKPKGNAIDRCRRLEQAGWNRIYREDSEYLCPVELGLANWVAEEASLRMNHMRVVERVTAVTGKYVREKHTAERFGETLLILWKVVTWIKGGNASKRPYLGKQRVQMRVGETISVSDRYPNYKSNRRQAVDRLTQDLQTALESLIV